MKFDVQQQRNNNSPPGNAYLDRDLTHTGLNTINRDISSSSSTDPSEHTSFSDLSYTHVFSVSGLSVIPMMPL